MAPYTDADDLDFPRLEREAYIRGDMTVAQLAAVAMDRREEVAGLEENVSDLEAQVKAMETEHANAIEDLHADIRRALSIVDTVLADCKRISKRAELEAALQAVYNIVAP